MKKALKIILIVILAIIVLLVSIPFLFKNKIREIALKEVNKSLTATISTGDFRLSLFRNFPNFYFRVDDFVIAGKGDFKGDTLAVVKSLGLTLNLGSVLNGNSYEIKKVTIRQPRIHIWVNSAGKANYDIVKPESETPETSDTTSSSFSLKLKKIEVSGMYIAYDDDEMNMHIKAQGLSHSLSGDLTADRTVLSTFTTFSNLDLSYGGIKYISKADADIRSDLDADIANSKYTFKDNEILLNKLKMNVDGWVALVGDDVNMDLAFNTPESGFGQLLSLIPAIYAKDFANIETRGTFSLKGIVKGTYNDKSLPAYSINLAVDKGYFKYPDLPRPIEDVSILASVVNDFSETDSLKIDVKQMHMSMAGNPVDLNLRLRKPLSDINIDSKILGKIDLGSVKEFYPLEQGQSFAGMIDLDVLLKGALSDLESGQYEKFTCEGFIRAANLLIKDPNMAKDIGVQDLRMNFSPAFVELAGFKATTGKSDLNASGKITNFLGYLFKNTLMEGTFDFSSSFLDVADLMPADTTAAPATLADTSASSSAPEIPANIHFVLTSSIGRLLYDNIELTDVKGLIELANQEINLKQLQMNALDGTITINGKYSNAGGNKPLADLGLDISNIDIRKAYNTFGMVETYAPIAAKTDGKFSTKFSLSTALDNELQPVYETMNGSGEFRTTMISVTNLNTLEKIASALKYDKIKSLTLEQILFQFEFVEGKVVVKPFDVKSGTMKATLEGWTALDQTIGYVMDMSIPRKEFGSAANQVLDGMVKKANSQGLGVTLGDNVNLTALIKGSISNPEVTTNLKESSKDLVNDLKQNALEELNKKKEEVKKDVQAKVDKILAEADQKAKQILDAAQKSADQVKKSAKDASEKLIAEADKQAANIEAEGKKKGFLAEKLAKESAKKVRDEARQKAEKMNSEAEKQANSIMDKARNEADQVKKQAQQKANEEIQKQ